jgi:ankyrin repeat protein
VKILRTYRRLARITPLVLIASVLIATGLRAGEIHDAAATGGLEKVKALLDSDPALLESKDQDGETPLIKACVGAADNITQATTARFLIDKGANVNASGPSGRTPLMCVNKRQAGSIDLIQRLIARGADVNARMSYTARNWTVFCGAAKSGNIEAARLLIQHGADINVRDVEGTPLQMAINNNRPISGTLADDRRLNEAMAVLLVESGAKLQEFSFGNTDLHLAAIRGFADLVRVLVRHGADVNAVNDYGRTPLYYAARHGQRAAAEALIAAGADRSAIVETNYGTATQLAAPLREGEAYLWYLAPKGSPNTGYAIKTRNNLLIFNPAWHSESLEAGLANGCLNSNELAGQKITVLFGHETPSGSDISELAKRVPGASFVFSSNPGVGDEGNRDMPPHRLAVAHEKLSVGGIQVHTIPTASRLFGREGLGYLVEADGLKIFHAGLHFSNNSSSNVAKFREEIDFLKPFGPIDVAILPIKGRHLETLAYEPYLYLIDQLSPRAIYLIGEELVTEEPKRCLEVLKARTVPVFYPEGGIATGERFHFLRERAQESKTAADTASQTTK